MPLALVACQHLWRGPWGLVTFVGGQDDTTVLVDEGLSGRARGGQGPLDLVDHLVGLRVSPRTSPVATARLRAHRAGGQECGLHPLLNSSQGLPRLRFTGTGGAAQFLQGLAFLGTRLAERLVDGTLRLRLAGLSVEEDPALGAAAVRRRQRLIAIALFERCHGLRLGVGQGGLGFVHGGRNTGEPLDCRLGELGAVVLALEGTVSHQSGGSIRGVSWLDGGMDATLLSITAVATERLHQHGNARLVFHHHL
jgi:hypothetical protein